MQKFVESVQYYNYLFYHIYVLLTVSHQACKLRRDTFILAYLETWNKHIAYNIMLLWFAIPKLQYERGYTPYTTHSCC